MKLIVMVQCDVREQFSQRQTRFYIDEKFDHDFLVDTLLEEVETVVVLGKGIPPFDRTRLVAAHLVNSISQPNKNVVVFEEDINFDFYKEVIDDCV